LKANGSDVLFVVTYSGKGASEKQFIETFATAGIRVVFAVAARGPWGRGGLVGEPARPQIAWISRTAWLIAQPCLF